MSESSRNGSESWATIGTRQPLELDSALTTTTQSHNGQPQMTQPYLSELSADRHSTRWRYDNWARQDGETCLRRGFSL